MTIIFRSTQAWSTHPPPPLTLTLRNPHTLHIKYDTSSTNLEVVTIPFHVPQAVFWSTVAAVDDGYTSYAPPAACKHNPAIDEWSTL